MPNADGARSGEKTSEARILCLVKMKKLLHLQNFSGIDKVIKKLLRIPNIIVNTSVLVIFR